MSEKKDNIVINSTVDVVCSLPCCICKVPTKHKVLFSANRERSEGKSFRTEKGISGVIYDWLQWDAFEVVRCQGCDEISFRIVSSNSENCDTDGELIIDERLYPPRITGRSMIADMHFLPANIQHLYNETYNAISIKLPVLSAAGLRALVEAVCNEKNARGSTLELKIDSLVGIGILTKAQSKVLHHLRFMGNDALHQVEIPKDKSMLLALDIVEYLLNTIYIIDKKAESLRCRK